MRGGNLIDGVRSVQLGIFADADYGNPTFPTIEILDIVILNNATLRCIELHLIDSDGPLPGQRYPARPRYIVVDPAMQGAKHCA